MQCEGITRAGRRCRNKALDDEIFCEIHLRVNRTYNLALLVPFLTLLLLCYFFIFGLLFDTLVYGVFELNYLKYAGLSDFFVSMFRTGGMLTVVVIKIWVAFSVLLALLFSIILVIHMIIQTSHRHLRAGHRLKIVTLSLGIFVLNFLHMFVFILPERNRKDPSHILIGREHMARSLKHQKQIAAQAFDEKPRAAALTYYQLFLSFCSFKNHRFSATLILMVLISTLSIYHAGEKAKETRNCVIDAVNNNTITTVTSSALYPGLNIANLCKASDEKPLEDVNLFLSYARTIGEFFTFPVVFFDVLSKGKPIIFIGSTERFELFFNGETRMPFAVPVQSLPALFPPAPEISFTKNPEFTVLKNTVQNNSQRVASLAKKIAKRPVLSSSVLKHKIARIEECANRSRSKLHRLKLGLDKVSYELFQMEKNSNNRIAASIPKGCWNREPHLILSFDVGAEKISSVFTINKIKNLAADLTKSERQVVVISGFSDPTGPQRDNDSLSRRRANEVKSLMLRAGLKEKTIYSVGHGENFSEILPRRRVEIRNCMPPLQRQAN